MLIATAVIALVVTTLQFCISRLPSLFLLTALASGVLAFLGLALISFSAVLALIIYASDDDGNRRFNLVQCRKLLGIGVVALLPLAVWVMVLPYT